LIQGSIDTVFDGRDTRLETLQQYMQLSHQALDIHGPLDLIVWPESMYPDPWIVLTEPIQIPFDEPDAGKYRAAIDQWLAASRTQARLIAAALKTPILVGAAKLAFGPHPMKRFNAALFFSAEGELIESYNKMHPVLFGEYVPLGKLMPGLYQLTPMPNGLESGTAPSCIELDGIRLSPCICFENMVPHLIRRQFNQLRSEGCAPDALLTVTNDGWFWGSSLLDAHLACAVFRAIELRRPMLIAANTGFSAWISPSGHIEQQGPRRDTGVVIAEVARAPTGQSVYAAVGDIAAAVCALFCAILTGLTWFGGRAKSTSKSPSPPTGPSA
jgi:apolipoprotein N-acyltransferase